MHRVFIAINPSKNIKNVLSDVLEKLKKIYRGAPIRFVRANGFHITLHFLADQNDEMIAKVSRVLDKVATQYELTKLMLDEFGFFPNETQPRVLWVGGEGTGRKILENLQKDLGKELTNLGIKIDNRDWRPHITLGRISGHISTPMIHSMGVPRVEWKVGSIELIESVLKPTGAEYKILHSAKLSKNLVN